MNEIKKRNGSIDFLKTIAILMVIVLHILGKGGILKGNEINSPSWYADWFLEGICIIAVNIFALCTGFLHQNKKFKVSNLVYLWFEVFFYSIIITIIFIIYDKSLYDYKLLLKGLFPVTFKQYWYFSSFVLLYILSPAINFLVNKVDKRIIKLCLIILGILFTIQSIWVDIFTLNSGYSALWLIYLYALGAYISKSKEEDKDNTSYKYNYLYIIGFIVSICLNFAIAMIHIKYDLRTDPFVLKYNYICNFISSFCFFMFFMNLNFRESKILKITSKTSLGVYLIHVHPLIFELVFKNYFKFITGYITILNILAVLGIALLIYLGCSIIDSLRYYLFKLIRLDKLSVMVENGFNKLIKKIFKIEL